MDVQSPQSLLSCHSPIRLAQIQNWIQGSLGQAVGRWTKSLVVEQNDRGSGGVTLAIDNETTRALIKPVN